MKPIVSVCLITYNHSKYIRQSIDSILMQQVDFGWELIIADDFSTDGTREILQEYKNKHPDFIQLILQPTNVGAGKNWLQLLSSANNKYIAYLEGDDYWLDPLKLQKQVDFMEANQDYSLCFTNSTIIFEGLGNATPYLKYNESKELSAFEVITGGGRFSPSASLVFRNYFKDINYPIFIKIAMSVDRALAYFLLSKGNIYVLNYSSCVYRKHQHGVFTSIKDNAPKQHEFAINNIEILESFNIYSEFKYKREIKIAKSKVSKYFLLKFNSLGHRKLGKSLYKHLSFGDWISFVFNLVKNL